MRAMDSKWILGVLVLLAAIIAAGPVHATPGECHRTILLSARRVAKLRIRALQKCEENIVKGKAGFPPGYDCETDPTVQMRIAGVEDTFRRAVQSVCGGKNKVCNAADTGKDADESLASIGWDIGSCPGFEGSGCTNAIADCNDIADCLFCVGHAAEAQTVALFCGALNLPAGDRGLTKCQQTIGDRGVFFYRKKLEALQICEKRVLSGNIPGPCPGADATKATIKLLAKVNAKICAKCGGHDKACGGGDDRTLVEIGFIGMCPNVTIPGGSSCGGAITSLADIVACVSCVTEFKVDCLDALAASGIKPYPPECLAVP